MTRIIAISNQKGGVAKTTSCITLGACLAELQHKVLIVDLDPQAHLSLAAGLEPDDLAYTLADLLENDPEALAAKQAIYPTVIPGLEILPADLRLSTLESGLAQQPDSEYILKQLLATWQTEESRANGNSYDFILLDCPPSMGFTTIIALSAANLALIPVQCEYFASRGLLRLLDIIDAVKLRTNPSLEYLIFISMYDSRNLVSRRVLEQLQDHFNDRLLESIIRLDTRLRESPMAGEPVISYAPRTRASQEYRDLAQELLARL